MSKKEILDAGKYLVFVIVMYLLIWSLAKLFADEVSDYETIYPKDGIECVVVSRMFNTSVDCWKTK